MVGAEKPCPSPDPDALVVTFTCPSTKQQYHLRLGGMRKGMTTNVQLSRAMLTLSTGRHLSAGYSGGTDSNPVAPHCAILGTSIRTM